VPCVSLAGCCLYGRWKSEVSELQKSLESRNQEFDKQTHLLNRLQKLVTYQKTEMTRLHIDEDAHRSLVSKTASLEEQLKVRRPGNVSG